MKQRIETQSSPSEQESYLDESHSASPQESAPESEEEWGYDQESNTSSNSKPLSSLTSRTESVNDSEAESNIELHSTETASTSKSPSLSASLATEVNNGSAESKSDDTDTLLNQVKEMIQSELEKEKISLFECYICKCEFNEISYLKTHFTEKHLKNDKLLCELCGLQCSKKYLKEHQKCVHETRQSFVCPLCEKRFIRKLKLKYHLEARHLKQYRRFCLDCGHQFYSTGTKYCHKKSCRKSTNQYCYDCCATFASVNDYKLHREKSHQFKYFKECHKCKWERKH